MEHKFTKKGMTAAETMIASAVAVIVIAGILMLTQFSQYIWKNERAKSNLIGKLEAAMERMQKEIRATDGLQIFYYPAAAATYTAMSFPLAVSDADGFVEVSGSPPEIVWSRTVVYHTFVNAGKVELRRTFFNPRQALTDSQRQAQLDNVVANGQPTASCPEYSSWDPATGTRTLCDGNSLALAIRPTAKFDGYSPAVARSENISLGSIRLAGGNHYITFTVEDKNPSSTGYGLGIDSFSVTPSGCVREAEEADVRDYDGFAPVPEEMSAYGNWSGNWQLEYRASGVGNHVSLNFYYDKWIETNFADSLPSSSGSSSTTVVEYSARTGQIDNVDSNPRAIDYIARLNGYGISWQAAAQTSAPSMGSEDFTSGSDGICFRNVIMSKSINVEGRAIKIAFDNTLNSQPLEIDYASIRARASGANEDTSAPAYPVKFGGVTPSEANPVSIATTSSPLPSSDWIDISNFDKSKDYLLTFHVKHDTGDHGISSWTPSDVSTADDQSYVILQGSIAAAQSATWPDGTYEAEKSVYTAGQITASYFSSNLTSPYVPMTLTSQVYDTKMSSPAYGEVAWNIARDNYDCYETGGPGADMVIRIRSGSDAANLPDWSTAYVRDTRSAVTGSDTTLGGIGSGQYVQFQAEFFSIPSPANQDYPESCALKNLSISWPGQNRIVDISGYFTRKPDYGIFSVRVDGRDLIKALELTLNITENTSGGRSVTKYLTAEAEPRSTGK